MLKKKLMKQCMAAVLSCAMAFTMAPGATASAAGEAVAAETVGTTQTIKAAKFVGSGSNVHDLAATTWIVATQKEDLNGNYTAAAYVRGETASENGAGMGSSRMAGMAFELPDGVDPNLVSNATVTINVEGCDPNQTHNADTGENRYMKGGLFRVDASCYETMVADSASTTAETYPAINEDYSYDATVFSKELIGDDYLGKKTFDVTDWVRESLKAGDAYAIYRLQTVLSAFYVTKEGDNMPTLSITTVTEEEAAGLAAESLSLGGSKVRGDITLPTEGEYGSKITWSSNKEDVISSEGKVTRGETDQDVELTASVKVGETATAEKKFTVTVIGSKSDADLLAAYVFADNAAKDVSGKGNDAQIKGTGAAVSNGILTLPGGEVGSDAAYVELPGKMFEGQDTLTITTWLRNRTGAGDYAAMYFGTKTNHVGAESDPDMPLHYWILNPAQPSGYFKSVWTNGDDASTPYSTETEVSSRGTNPEWGMYTTVITPDSIKGYYNGVEVSSAEKSVTTTQFGNDLVAFIGRSAYNDKFYAGDVYGVEIYKTALTPEQIQEKYYATSAPAGVNAQEMFEAVADGLEKEFLGGNSAEGVSRQLHFVEEVNGVKITWQTTDPDHKIIGADGKVVKGASGDVTITATGAYGGKTVFTKQYTIKAEYVNPTVTISQEKMELYEADTAKLTATVEPANASETAVTWSSSDTDVAEVSEDGEITAKKAGTAKISAKAGDSTASCEVTVKRYVEVTGVATDPAELKLEIGGKGDLKAVLTPADTTNTEVRWTSGNTKVARVTPAKGLETSVTAVAEGTAEITATVTTKAGDKVTAVCKVTVEPQKVPVTKVELSQAALTLEVSKTASLTATVAPEDATDKSVTWTSSDETVATVADGVVTAKKAGKATITAASVSNPEVTAACEVTVEEAQSVTPVTPPAQSKVKSVKLNVKKLTLGVKETYSLKATVAPAGAAKVTWKSSDNKAVTVKNGKLTAKKTAKKVTITATAGGKSASCTVVVKNAPTKKTVVSLNKKNVSLKAKKTFQIKAKVKGNFGSNSFKYTSSKKKVAKVDKNGKVTAVKKGTATITVKTYNGKAKATLKVKVK